MDPLWHPGSNIMSGWEKKPKGSNQPVYSYELGLEFVSGMKQNTGWWSDYVTSLKRMWRLLIALGYGYEASSAYININIQELMPQAMANKLNALVSEYGDAGYYIFLGSLQTIRNRVDDIQGGMLDRPLNMEDAFTRTSGVWNGSLISSDPNAPFDFANPMPDIHPDELLSRLDKFANACQDKVNGCDTRSLSGTLYVLASNSDGGPWEILFIVLYTQVMSWKKK